MTKQIIAIGSAVNDGTGDPARTCFTKTNGNFTEVYDFLGGAAGTTNLPTALPVSKGGTGSTTAANARNALGLGTAALGTLTNTKEDSVTGKVLRVGDFGLGDGAPLTVDSLPLTVGEVNILCRRATGSSSAAHGLPSGTFAMSTYAVSAAQTFAIFYPQNVTHDIYCGNLTLNSGSSSVKRFFKLLSTYNTTVDANGFIKSASPIIKLFAESIELNDEAKQQPVNFEKLGIGNYLIEGSLGFAQEGWYIEVPKDANGNTIVAVVYDTLENGDISIKTFKCKFDIELAAVVADLDNPLDIPEGRWIDIRLHEEPQAEVIPDDTEQ